MQTVHLGETKLNKTKTKKRTTKSPMIYSLWLDRYCHRLRRMCAINTSFNFYLLLADVLFYYAKINTAFV